jgi:hypothetical protein
MNMHCLTFVITFTDINYQLSIINYQLSIINYQLSIINYQLSIINYQLSIAKITLDDIVWNVNVSEGRLAGILCFSVNMFNMNPPYDIKIQLDESYGSSSKWNLFHSMDHTFYLRESIHHINDFCVKLMNSADTNANSDSFLEMFTNHDSNIGFKYYLDHDMHDEFAKGYIWMGNHWKSSVKDQNNDTYISQFLCKVRQIENVERNYQFKLRVPSHRWDLPKLTDVSEKHLVMVLLELFLQDCPNDLNKLIHNKTYLRFMLFQDQPDHQIDSFPYVYGYVRKIDQCVCVSDQQIETLLSCPIDHFVCEITFASRGYFFIFKKDDWMNKKITNVVELL